MPIGPNDIRLSGIRGFHVGGELMNLQGLPTRKIPTLRGRPLRAADPNGTYAVGQMYVQEFLLAEPASPLMLQLWHGGGLTGACWEDTPDGRPGWVAHFLRSGYSVALCDASERGRAGWAPYPIINAEAPWHRTMEMAWSMFRFGPPGGYRTQGDECIAYPETQFPVAFANQLLKQFVARWGSRQSDVWATAAYRNYIAQRSESVIVAHSQGGLYALDLLAAAPGCLRTLVCLEPVLPPERDYPFENLAGLPLLIVVGDNIDITHYTAFVAAARQAGANAELCHLPSVGIAGNSHMMMMDRNSDQIADMVTDWLSENAHRHLLRQSAGSE